MWTPMPLRWIEQAEAQRVRRDLSFDDRAMPLLSQTAGGALAVWLAQAPLPASSGGAQSLAIGARVAAAAAGSADRSEPRG